MGYEFGKFFEQEIEQGAKIVPDIGYKIPSEIENQFLLNNLSSRPLPFPAERAEIKAGEGF